MKNIILAPFTFLVFISCAVEKQQPVAKPSTSVNSISKTQFTQVVDFQKEFLKRINNARAIGCKCGDKYMAPAEPLIWNTQLQLSALGHAQDMARNKYFNHISKNGSKIKDRISAAGYTHEGFQNYTIGENIAYNQRTIKEVMDAWLKSPGHCLNIMNPAFKEVGIAMQNYYWVQNFGARIPFAKRNGR